MTQPQLIGTQGLICNLVWFVDLSQPKAHCSLDPKVVTT